MSGDSDERELMGEVSAGSVVAFGQLYDRFCSRAYGVAYAVCRDEGRARDAVQDTFLYLWTDPSELSPRARYGCRLAAHEGALSRDRPGPTRPRPRV
jgi:DNA-directed RNA polymerase specialized sigma24 family protein